MKIDMADFQAQINKAIDNFLYASVKAETAVERQLVESAILVENDAKLNINSVSGRLANSITHRIVREDGVMVAEVGTNVFYGPYVEFGTGIHAKDGNGRKEPWWYQNQDGDWIYTHGSRPYPFMNPALEKNLSQIESDIAAAIKGALG